MLGFMMDEGSVHVSVLVAFALALALSSRMELRELDVYILVN